LGGRHYRHHDSECTFLAPLDIQANILCTGCPTHP
jgi:hypothetical protein